MGKREDQMIAALAKKNAERVITPKKDKAVQFDSTLVKRMADEDPEAGQLFKDMKKREF
jgi:hypothetical protein